MKRILIILSVFIFSFCNPEPRLLIKKTWMPINANDYEGRNNISEYLLYAPTFKDSGNMVLNLLGANHVSTMNYQILNEQLLVSPHQDFDTLDIVSVSEKELVIKYDQFNIVTYQPFFDGRMTDISDSIRRKVVEESWYLSVSNDSNKFLIEFKDSLENTIVLPLLREQLATAKMHYFDKNYSTSHLNVVWGVSYFKGWNMLMLRELLNSYQGVYYIEKMGDEEMSGFTYINGIKEVVSLKKVENIRERVEMQILGKWHLEEYKKVHDAITEFSSSFWDLEGGIRESDFEIKQIIMNLDDDGSFYRLVDLDTLEKGRWRIENSGKLLELISEIKEGEIRRSRSNFLTVLGLDSARLKIFRNEYVKVEDNEFEVTKFIEQFKKTDN
ncbi:hypothetical protein LVD17_27995 [Fulvivirga ulvae]|uniref:hypothetical protein n=1 Tax=Fulvivirga ulvae TaxID=2904245 RepID=UPI001F47AF89|nr:hypothetical protein [Fulvivirga ulvae]UII32131.1 hypothetical protein LVD17_27995 [Fulvivirga ulvae]